MSDGQGCVLAVPTSPESITDWAGCEIRDKQYAEKKMKRETFILTEDVKTYTCSIAAFRSLRMWMCALNDA